MKFNFKYRGNKSYENKIIYTSLYIYLFFFCLLIFHLNVTYRKWKNGKCPLWFSQLDLAQYPRQNIRSEDSKVIKASELRFLWRARESINGGLFKGDSSAERLYARMLKCIRFRPICHTATPLFRCLVKRGTNKESWWWDTREIARPGMI